MRARLLRLHALAAPLEVVAHWEQRIAAAEAMPRTGSLVDAVDAFERDVGLLPLSVRAWYEVVGGVNFVGLHSGWLDLLSDADAAVEEARERKEFLRGEVSQPFHRLAQLKPLFVYPLDTTRAWADGHSVGVYHLPLMPDPFSLFGAHGRAAVCGRRRPTAPRASRDDLRHLSAHLLPLGRLSRVGAYGDETRAGFVVPHGRFAAHVRRRRRGAAKQSFERFRSGEPLERAWRQEQIDNGQYPSAR
jgi:hypothetical protein